MRKLHDTPTLAATIQKLEAALSNNSRADCITAAKLLASRDDLTAKAHLLLSEVYRREGKLDESVSAASTAVAQEQGHPHYAAQLAFCLLCSGNFAKVSDVLARSKALNFYDPWSLEKLAMAAASIDEHETALFFYTISDEQTSGIHSLKYNQAISSAAIGDFANAEAFLRAIPDTSALTGKKFWGLSLIGKLSTTDTEKLLRFSRIPNLDPENRIYSSFAVADRLDKDKAYDQAFHFYNLGNQAKRSRVNYSKHRERERFDKLKQLFSKHWVTDTQSGTAEEKILFVVGLPRTGTTLVDRVLSAHPQVDSMGELRNFGITIKKLCRQPLTLDFDLKTIEASAALPAQDIGAHYVEGLPRKNEPGGYLIDKNPLNFLYIPLIAKSLPNAKIIHMSRNPMDTCFSNFRQLFASIGFYSYSLEEVVEYYLLYRNLLAHWGDYFPEQLTTVEYEEFVKSPAAETQRLLNFIGLEMDERCLNFHKEAGQVATASAAQARKPIYSSSVGKWRNYEKHLTLVREALIEAGIPVDSRPD